MKKFALIAAVVFTTLTLESCRQEDEILSPIEAATLKKVQDSTNKTPDSSSVNSIDDDQTTTSLEADGEIVPPPRR